MESAVQYLGNTDDVTSCDCCGRTELKSTVALLIGESTEPVYYGVICAARALGRTSKEVRQAARAADDAAHAKKMAESKAAADASFARWEAWLTSKAPALRGDVFRQIESLGGYTAANAAYRAEVAA